MAASRFAHNTPAGVTRKPAEQNPRRQVAEEFDSVGHRSGSQPLPAHVRMRHHTADPAHAHRLSVRQRVAYQETGVGHKTIVTVPYEHSVG